MNIYYLQCCFRKPIVILLSTTLIICLLLVINQYHNHHDSYYHNSALKRRNISSSDYNGQSEGNSQIRDELLLRIGDLRRIKLSIRNELKLIERDKNKLLKEKASLLSKNDKLLTLISKSKTQLKQLELDIAANRKQKFEKNCDIESIPPIIYNPMKSVDLQKFSYQLSLENENNHELNATETKTITTSQFDYSDCSLAKEFKFYLMKQSNDNAIESNHSLEFDSAIRILESHRQHTDDINYACLIVYMLDTEPLNSIQFPKNKNILIITSYISDISYDIPKNVALASSIFYKNKFREHFDIILPSIWQSPSSFSTIVGSMPPQSPIERKYLASYFGRDSSDQEERIYLESLEVILQTIHRDSIDDLFLFSYSCGKNSETNCYDEKDKMVVLSTFMIILASSKNVVDDYANDLLYLALSKGAIPVIIGIERTKLPFCEVLDWRRASIQLPTGRLPELHFILRTINPTDIYQMKTHGRRIFETYLATMKQILDTTLSIVSVQRFNYPPIAVEEVKTLTYYDKSKKGIIYDLNCTSIECQEGRTDSINTLLMNEILGPRERPFPSRTFRRNFTLVFNSAYDLWNSPFYSPHRLHPNYPNDPIPPSEYKFYAAEQNYRPINEGLGGSGVEFSRSLGGDYPNEQFTIVLLTYERNSLLMKTLERLKGLPFLNKILVVWNGIKHEPSASLVWPDVGVPIVVVKTNQNSLNNRFLPYDAIETEAILSLDDDSPLRQDEIVFGFRVWRESRDRIVGFPGRFHAWDQNQNSWLYNSNHSCELSMVLTGGAFFHKYYSYVYTYQMPQVIHSIVDKFMNCEDIAMNFLVAHLTRKPPIKVTSRWTFHCASCTSSLSEDDSHFRERHECLNTFVSIYGYMPLLNTQLRSDSVLFKTKIPHDKQKCFKFV